MTEVIGNYIQCYKLQLKNEELLNTLLKLNLFNIWFRCTHCKMNRYEIHEIINYKIYN